MFDIEKFINGLHEYLGRALGPMEQRIVQLEAINKGLVDRVATLEESGIAYKGVWQPASQYTRGDLATHDGSLWHCNETTRQRPGDGKAWQLAVKKGRDAR